MTNAILWLALLLAQVPQQARPPAASIEGTVRRAGTGEPVYRARVTLVFSPMPSSTPTPPLAFSPPKTFTTDKAGRFAFADLQSGRYSLSVQANGYVRTTYGQRSQNQPGTPIELTAGQQQKDIVIDMTPAATITGRVYDSDNLPMANADVILQRSAYDPNGQRTLQASQQGRTNDLGEYRLFWVTPGKYYLVAQYTGTPTMGSRNPNEFSGPVEDGYVPTYYPGTADPAAASEVDVLSGADLSAMDLTLMKTTTFRVRGRVIMPATDNPNVRPFVSLRPKTPIGGMISTSSNMTMSPEGTFEIRGVTAGSYVLTANAGSGTTGLRSEKAIDVNNDVDGVIITLTPGFDLHGRIVFESRAPSDANSSNPFANARVFIRPASTGIFGSMNAPVLKPDGSFTIPQVTPGTYQVSLLPLPGPDYYVKAVMLGRTDVLRDGFTVDRTPDTLLEIVLNGNAGRIEGSLIDNQGKPVPGTQVLLMPNDRTRSDLYKFGFTDTSGRFTIRGIHPGDYKLFAMDTIEPGAHRDPEFMRRYEEQGTRVVIGESTNASVEIRLIKVN